MLNDLTFYESLYGKSDLALFKWQQASGGGTPTSSYYVKYTTFSDETPVIVYFDDSEELYDWCLNKTTADKESIKTMKVANPVNTHNTMYYMFSGYSNMESIDLSSFDTSGVTNMYSLFSYCSSLTTIDVSGFDTSDVTNMSGMFQYCSGLTELDLSNFDTSNVDNTSYMFVYCQNLTTEITIMANTTTYTNMFDNCATADGAEVVVKYTDDTYDTAVAMVATKSSTSNVVLHYDIPTDVDAYIYDYAESFGNSYSRIDYIPVYGDKIEYEFEPTGIAVSFNFGTRYGNSSRGYSLISNSYSGWVGYGGATTNTPAMASTLNEVHTVKMSKDGIFLDDVEISYTTVGEDGLYNMVIGALGTGEITIDTRSATAKHRAFTVYSEDDALKHRILAVVKDDVCQLYDNATDTYYPSLADEYGQGNLIGYVLNGIAYNMDGTEMFPTTAYYACYTDSGIGYYTDVIPEIGDTGLNMYDSDFNLIATDGAVTAFTLSGTTYPLITSDDLNLVVVRWNDNYDVTV